MMHYAGTLPVCCTAAQQSAPAIKKEAEEEEEEEDEEEEAGVSSSGLPLLLKPAPKDGQAQQHGTHTAPFYATADLAKERAMLLLSRMFARLMRVKVQWCCDSRLVDVL